MAQSIELSCGRSIQYKTIEQAAILEESSDPDATYSTIWVGATRALCWLIDQCPEIKNSSVLEVGCGQGLAGMYCATYAEPSRVVLSDASKAALSMVDENAKQNDVADSITTRIIDVSQEPHCEEKFDFVILSDMLFSSKVSKEVFEHCRSLVKSGGAVLVGHEKRYSVYLDPTTKEIKQDDSDEPLKLFLDLAKKERWLTTITEPFNDEPNLLSIRIDCK